jgi:hypothetical protein
MSLFDKELIPHSSSGDLIKDANTLSVLTGYAKQLQICPYMHCVLHSQLLYYELGQQ